MGCMGPSVVSGLTAVGVQAGRAGPQPGWLWKLLHAVAAYLMVSGARSSASGSEALEWIVLGWFWLASGKGWVPGWLAVEAGEFPGAALIEYSDF